MIKIKIPLPTDTVPTITFMNPNGEECFSFIGDIEYIDDIIDWLYISTKGRFVLLGTSHIYFENEKDAAAFKIKFGGENA